MSLFEFILAQAEGAGGQEQGQQDPGNPLSFLWPMIIIFGIFYLLIFRPEKKKRKAREQMVAAVKKGDTVVTTGGIKGLVKRVDNDEVVVQIDKDKDVKVRFLKAAVLEVLSTGEQSGDSASEDTQRELEERARR